jgi:D-alanine transaminase
MAAALPVAWLDGAFLPLAEARISPLDRGFLFGDAVYEVIGAYDGRPLLLDAHLARLARSLRELRIDSPHDDAGWRAIIAGLIERNGGGRAHPDMGLYLQVSRGADDHRDHCFPRGVAPTVFAMASRLEPTHLETPGVRAITAPDNRWGRCDIKSTALLANILLRQAAAEAGAGECILLRDGFVTEGSGSSVLVLEGRNLASRPNSPEILPGTTLELVREVAAAAGFGYREEAISEARLRAADEVWLTAALRGVAPVTHVDGRPIGRGVPGPAWRVVAEAYERHKRP